MTSLSPDGVESMDIDQQENTKPDNTTDVIMTDAATAALEEEARLAIDMLRGDDVSGRVAAASRLETLAAALGQERTRDELIPFLTDGVDDEDEVLVAMAESIGKLVKYVGGAEHAHTLLVPLELLLTVEEGTVRDAASASAKSISEILPDDDFTDAYASMLVRLATKEWFTARLSAAGLLSSAYKRLSTPEQRQEFLNLFVALCRDDTPMVRRVASQYLGHFVQVCVELHGRAALDEGDDKQSGQVVKQLFPLYTELADNEQPDSVRLQTTANCVAFGQAVSSLSGDANSTLSDSEIQLVQRLLPLIVATIDDRSWRVRWTAASKFADVIDAYQNIPNTMDALVPAYEKLLQDPEAEVRTAATFNLAAVCKCPAQVLLEDTQTEGGEGGDAAEKAAAQQKQPPLDAPRVSVAERLVKRVTNLTEDDSEHVRAALALVATELAPILGKDATITHLVPPVLLLLRDAASEVRLNLISSLSALNQVIGVDLLSQSLLPAILDLAQDGKWRIRLAIIQHIPLLAKQLGKEFFSDKLASLCVGWLGDDISSIRQASATNLKELVSLFGTAWATQYIIPSIKDIRKHPSYLRRLTAVQACAMMSTEMDVEVVKTELLPMVLEMAADTVPNIRFNVAKALETIAPVCGKEVYESQIHPVLSVLVEDSDRDVRFFSSHALRVLDGELTS